MLAMRPLFQDTTRLFFMLMLFVGIMAIVALFLNINPYSHGNILILLGLLPALWSLYATRNCLKTRSWKRIRGEIVQTAVERGHAESFGNVGAYEKYYPKISYRYTLPKQTYTASQLSLFDDDYSFTYEDDALDFNAKFPPGSSVIVWIHPERHEHAVIMPTCSAQKLRALTGYGITGALIILLGFYVMLR